LRTVKYECEFKYCQSQIEDRKRCKSQCNHCKEYYAPLENQVQTIRSATAKASKSKKAAKRFLKDAGII